MRELLEEWARVEPERCRFRDDVVSEKYPVVVDVQIEGLTSTLTPDSRTPCIHYLQGAVQEAIEARGWDWSLDTAVIEGCRVYVGDVNKDNVEGAQANGFTPGEALLKAYLEALSPV